MHIPASLRRPVAGALLALATIALAVAPAPAAGDGDAYPHDGMRVIESEKSYDRLVADFNAAVEAQEAVFVVTRASATKGVKAAFGEDIPGNMVAGVYGPSFARRMLAASIPAGYEAPIRFYITEDPETGTATLAYRRPSDVFAPYDSSDLDDMARELDAIFADIAEQATR